jgi:hypothetical protein
MKAVMYILALMALVGLAQGSQGIIINGCQPGEIFFVGPMSQYYGVSGFYYSSDYGQTIELRDSTGSIDIDNFGYLLNDPAYNHIYRIYDNYDPFNSSRIHSYSEDGGYTWVITDCLYYDCGYFASGITAGEIYRAYVNTPDYIFERSINYGFNYIQCNHTGLNNFGSMALGTIPGEIFIYDYPENLYYSSDYGETFAVLNNLNSQWGVDPHAWIYNGAVAGETYIYNNEWQAIWRVYNYGANADLITCFGIFEWYVSGITATNIPGELYIVISQFYINPGGTIIILHTTDYGAHWTEYDHQIPPVAVSRNSTVVPAKVSLSLFPNPCNDETLLTFNLPYNCDIELKIYDLNGREVSLVTAGEYAAGEYKVKLDARDLSSGIYFARLTAGNMQETVKMVLLK